MGIHVHGVLMTFSVDFIFVSNFCVVLPHTHSDYTHVIQVIKRTEAL